MKFWTAVLFMLTIGILIWEGWAAALSFLFFVCFFVGIWEICGWMAGAVTRRVFPESPQDPLSGPPVYDWADDAAWIYRDPTRPQPWEDDEHPVINLRQLQIQEDTMTIAEIELAIDEDDEAVVTALLAQVLKYAKSLGFYSYEERED